MANKFKHFIYNKKYIIVICVIIFIAFEILLSMHASLSPDETFSMGLIRYNYSKIICLDSMDVHPPLYYFLLKMFVSITTFYTTSLYIKVLFARILSIIFSLIGFIFLYKLLEFIGIRQHILMSFILFSLIPYNITMLQNSMNTDIGSFTNIRMYALAFMLITIEFYNSLKFKYCRKIHFIVLATIFASLASYTHNLSAMIAGLILLLFMINTRNNKRIAIKFLCSGVSLILLYIPWMPIALKQSKSFRMNIPFVIYIIDKCKSMIKDMLLTTDVIYTIFLLVLFIVSIYVIKDSNIKLTDTIYISGITLIITFVLMVIISPRQKFLYLYPLLGIYIYVIFNELLNSSSIKLNLKVIVGIMTFIMFIGGSIEHFNQYDNHIMYKNISKCINSHKSYTKIPYGSYYSSNSVILLNNEAIYSEYKGKRIINANKYYVDKNLAATQNHKIRHFIYNNPIN